MHARTHTRTHNYHVSHSNPCATSKLLHQRMVVRREECSALDTLSQLTHNSTGYGSSIVSSRAPAYGGKTARRAKPAESSTTTSLIWPTQLRNLYPPILPTHLRTYVHTYIDITDQSLQIYGQPLSQLSHGRVGYRSGSHQFWSSWLPFSPSLVFLHRV